jgi:NADH-ubiquinone oxidoreductase chain 5
MEGPTPVSALLHAATMVTAGIYLLMRLNILIEWSDDLLLIISWFGGLSALTGALGGFYDLDIKKIIAYSTISQLGYMVISVGFSLYSITLWHLINHALFKALLFLSAGAILHNVADVQDIRKYGSLKFYQPNLYLFILIGNLSIMAFPFMTGFYSKDLILDLIFSTHSNFLFFLIYIAALFTASYSLKLLIFTFLAQPNFTFSNQPLTHSLSLSFFIPLFTLSLGAIFFGDLSTGIFNTLDFSIHPSHFIEKNNLIFHLASNLTVVPLLFFLLLIISPKFINYSVFTFIFPSVLTNINLIWSALLLRIFNYSNVFLRYIDRGLLEILTPYGLNLFFHYLAYRLELLSTGYFNHLLLPLILFLIIFFI